MANNFLTNPNLHSTAHGSVVEIRNEIDKQFFPPFSIQRNKRKSHTYREFNGFKSL